jgi:intracellular multiplication protein IcmP
MMRPQPNPRASWPSSDDNTVFYLLVVVAGSAIGGYLLWQHDHAMISAVVMRLQHWQMRLIHYVTDRYDVADRQVQQAHTDSVSFWQLYGLCRDVGRFFRLPAAAIMFLLGAVCFVCAGPARYRRCFDLSLLVREQARIFRSTAAFVARGLRLTRPAEGEPRPADFALTPAEWVERYALGGKGKFDEAAARRELVRQLGPVWHGAEQAPPHVRSLFAIFALHLAGRQLECAEFLGDVSEALSLTGKEDPEGPANPLRFPDALVANADALLLDPELREPGATIARGHAYATPVLMSLLNAARLKSGVLPPAQFAWLKLVDRRLWYALSSLGFETESVGRYLHPNPRVEAVGARDHWAVERAAGMVLLEPQLDRAIAAIRMASGHAVANRSP